MLPETLASLERMNGLRKLSYVWNHPGNHKRRGRALMRSAWFLTGHRITGRPLIVPLGERSRIVGYPDSYGGASAVYGSPGPDFREVAAWRRVIRRGDLVLDVGANEGLYTVLFAEMGADVVAFEPDVVASRRLRENLALNGYSADVRSEAVSSRSGSLLFTVDRGTSNAIVDASQVGARSHTVPTTTIDLVLGPRHARGVKVDVEGAELEVLLGASTAMREGRIDVFQLEWNDMSTNYGTGRDEIADVLRSHGYELCRPRSDGELEPTEAAIGSDVIAVRSGVELDA